MAISLKSVRCGTKFCMSCVIPKTFCHPLYVVWNDLLLNVSVYVRHV